MRSRGQNVDDIVATSMSRRDAALRTWRRSAGRWVFDALVLWRGGFVADRAFWAAYPAVLPAVRRHHRRFATALSLLLLPDAVRRRWPRSILGRIEDSGPCPLEPDRGAPWEKFTGVFNRGSTAVSSFTPGAPAS